MGVRKLYASNVKPSYNKAKAIEEMGELTTALCQEDTKTGISGEDHKRAIIEEIGDVIIQLQILKKMYGKEAVNQRITEKETKLQRYYLRNQVPKLPLVEVSDRDV